MTESDPDPHQPTAAIILATGQTERMQSRRATSLHALACRPMAAYPIQATLDAGYSPVVVSGSAETSALEDYLSVAGGCVFLGDSNWLEAAYDVLPDSSGTVLLISGAMPLVSEEMLARLVQCQRETSCQLVVLTAPSADTTQSSSGLVRDVGGRIECILTNEDPIEDPRAEFFSTGVMCVARSWLWEHRDAIQVHDADRLAALAVLALAEGAKIETVHHTGAVDELIVVEDRTDMALVESTLRARIRTRAMRGGVTLVDRSTK